jgi:hypothetical protein
LGDDMEPGNGFGVGTGSRWWFFWGKKELYSIYSIHVMGCQPLLWCYMKEELHLVLTLYLLWLWDVYMFYLCSPASHLPAPLQCCQVLWVPSCALPSVSASCRGRSVCFSDM